MRVKHLFILSLVAVATGARAQHAPAGDTVMKGATIEVLQSYKPQVKQAPKPEWMPQLPPADTSHPTFSYDVPQQSLYYTYSSLPLRPLALGKDPLALPFENYVKLGAGNLSTLYLDAGIGSIKGSNYETAIHLHHISQSGSIDNEKTALSGIEAEGILHNDFSDWHALINVERNQYYYYGYDHDRFIYNANDVKQTYTTIRAVVDTKNKPDSNEKFTYNPSINASLYTAALNTTETTIGFNAPFMYQFDPAVQGQVSVLGAVTGLKTDLGTSNNNFIELLPGINVHTGGYSGHALLGFVAGESKGYVLPDIMAAYAIPDTKFGISAGWQSLLRRNTYEELSTENPYIFNAYTVTQSRSDELYAGLTGSVGNYLSFSGRASWWNYSGLPAFLNEGPMTGDKQFVVLYDNTNALSLQLAARYKVADIWTAGATGTFYHFMNGSLPHIWNEPQIKIKGDFSVLLFDKLSVSAYLALMGGTYALDISGNTQTLAPAFDAGFGAEYPLIKRLTVFAQVNNLFDDKYQRFYGYQAYGLNVYGGLRLKF